jgi:hypothetical protein
VVPLSLGRRGLRLRHRFRKSLAAITGLDTTDPRHPDPQPGIASSFGPLAVPGVAHQPRLVPAHGPGPLSSTWPADEGHRRSGSSRPGDTTVWAARPTFRTASGATWCRLCTSRAGHDGVHGTIAWGTCGARSTAKHRRGNRCGGSSQAAAAGGRYE